MIQRRQKKREKKFEWILLMCLLGFMLSGCRQQPQEETGYRIFYVDEEGIRLQESRYSPEAQSFEELMDEFSEKLSEAPAGMMSALKKNVKITGYQRGIDALRIDFNEAYHSLDNIEEVLLRAAVIKTFSQIPGVTKIMITVNGEQIKDAQGNLIPAMEADSFINTKEGGINSYQYASLSLYFLDKTGNNLTKENRNLHYSSNMVLENVVAEQLIKGPKDSDMQPLFTGSVKVLGVHRNLKICTIDFDENVNQNPIEKTQDPETVIWAVVMSLCDTCDDVEGVRIRINGESDVLFRNSVSLNQIFYLDEQGELQKRSIEDTEKELDSTEHETLYETEPAETEAETKAKPDETEMIIEAQTQEAETQQMDSGQETEDPKTGQNKGSAGMVGVDPTLTESKG